MDMSGIATSDLQVILNDYNRQVAAGFEPALRAEWREQAAEIAAEIARRNTEEI